MKRFIARYRSLVTGVLSGFDRLVFRGHILPLMREGGMYFFLEAASVRLLDFKKFVLDNPVYLNDYISEDGRIAAFVIRPQAAVAETGIQDAIDQFDDEPPAADAGAEKSARRHYLSKQENHEVMAAVNAITARFEASDFKIALAGGPVSETVYDRLTTSNMRKFTLIMMLVVLFFLYLLFRRISGALYPLIIVYCTLFSTLGVMAASGVSISVFSVILPSFLMAVGIADAVHIQSIFYRRIQQGKEKYDAIAFALGHSGFAVVLTSVTTAAGLLSFSLSEINSIANLGVFAAIGVGLALLYTVVMLPAFLALTPIRQKTQKKKSPGALTRMDRALLFFANASSSSPRTILVVSVLLLVGLIPCLAQLKFAHNMKNMFPPEMKVRRDLDFIDKELKGVPSIEIVVDTKKENGLHNPEILAKIEKVNTELAARPGGEMFVGKIRCLNDILKEIHQALHGNDPAYYVIPDNPTLIAQELLLFENSGSDDLERIVDSGFSKTRVSIKIPWAEVLTVDAFIRDVHHRYEEELAGLAEVSVTGMMTISGEAISASIRSMSKSYVIAFIVISMLMVVLVGELKLGLLSMIPNLIPILLIMGLMGLLGITIDLNALMIGSIAIGLVVDDTMHFMYNFKKYNQIKRDPRAAIRETMLGAGRALLITSLVLAANFFVLMAGELLTTTKFGFFTGLVILVALLIDFILAPALLIFVSPKAGEASDRAPGIRTPIPDANQVN